MNYGTDLTSGIDLIEKDPSEVFQERPIHSFILVICGIVLIFTQLKIYKDNQTILQTVNFHVKQYEAKTLYIIGVVTIALVFSMLFLNFIFHVKINNVFIVFVSTDTDAFYSLSFSVICSFQFLWFNVIPCIFVMRSPNIKIFIKQKYVSLIIY